MTKKEKKEYNKFVVKTVENLKERGEFSWSKVADVVSKEYPEARVNMEQVRSKYRYITNKSGTRDTQKRLKTSYKLSSAGIDDFEDRLLTLLKNRQEVNNLAIRLGIDFETLLKEVTKLELKGIVLNKWLENGKSYIRVDRDKPVAYNENTYNLEAEDQAKFLILSDTHFGHKKSQIAFTQELIHTAYARGVRSVFHVGDLTEGHYMSIRPLSIRELDAIGFDEQLELTDKSLPKLDGLTYYVISGNHDLSHERNSFANPVKTLAKIRPDVKYLGHNFAKIWINDTIDIALIHPTDGIGQNYGLKLRQHIDRNTEDRTARFIFMGHYHKFTHLHYRGMDAWVVPALIKQSEFMTDKNLESVVGGILLTLNLGEEGDLVSFTPEYFFLDE